MNRGFVHGVTLPSLKYCTKVENGLGWGKAGRSLARGRPLLLPQLLKRRSDPPPGAPHVSRVSTSVPGLLGLKSPVYGSPAARTQRLSSHVLCPRGFVPFASCAFLSNTFRSLPFLPGLGFNSCHAFTALSKFPSEHSPRSLTFLQTPPACPPPRTKAARPAMIPMVTELRI